MLQKVLILATNMNVVHNSFDGPNKIVFRSVFQQNRSFRVRVRACVCSVRVRALQKKLSRG